MKPLKRYVEPVIINDLTRKMVFLAGPRQTGKTTVAKELIKRANRDITTRYLNWDSGEDRENILQERFPADDGILVLDEIHKYRRWRQLVKGLYDKRGERLQILWSREVPGLIITGTAAIHFRGDIIFTACIRFPLPKYRAALRPILKTSLPTAAFQSPSFSPRQQRPNAGAGNTVPAW